MPNGRFREARVACWLCVREDEWVFCEDSSPVVEHYGYVRVSGILIPACEPCARRNAGLENAEFDFPGWRREAFLQQRLSCEYQTNRRMRREASKVSVARRERF
jgi:hypothetical protein